MNIENLRPQYVQALVTADLDELIKGIHARARYWRRENLGEFPHGDYDAAGLWQPSDRDAEAMSPDIPPPTEAEPFTYRDACYSIYHCERLDGATHEAVRLITNINARLHIVIDEEQIAQLQAEAREAVLGKLPAPTTDEESIARL